MDKVKKLLDIGADVNATDQDGWTALMWACFSGRLEMAKIFIQRGANPNAADFFQNNTPLMLACARKHLEIVKILIKSDADVNITDVGGREGNTALIIASIEGHSEIVRYLKQSGAQD